jgi:hypothetical protein
MTDAGEPIARLSIREMCARWKETATRGGGIAIGGESEAYRLHANGIAFHDLHYAELERQPWASRTSCCSLD